MKNVSALTDYCVLLWICVSHMYLRITFNCVVEEVVLLQLYSLILVVCSCLLSSINQLEIVLAYAS